MPIRHFWTPAEDDILRAYRLNSCGWAEIAHALGVSASSARERARAIGIRRPRHMPADDPADPPQDPYREPLPAGHPVAWAVLTDSTLLAGTTSPWPPLPPATASIHSSEA
jgi:hypothetical protein